MEMATRGDEVMREICHVMKMWSEVSRRLIMWHGFIDN